MTAEEILTKYDRLIWRFAKGDEDFAQDLRLAIMEEIGTYKGFRGSPGTWIGLLVRELRSKSKQKHMRCNRSAIVLPLIDEYEPLSHDGGIEDAATIIDLREAMALLPRCWRMALADCVFNPTTATRTSKEYASRARRMLREQLA